MPSLETPRTPTQKCDVGSGKRRKTIPCISEGHFSKILRDTRAWDRYKWGSSWNGQRRRLRLRERKWNLQGHRPNIQGSKDLYSSDLWAGVLTPQAPEQVAAAKNIWVEEGCRVGSPWGQASVYFIKTLASWRGSGLSLISFSCFMKPIKWSQWNILLAALGVF